MKRLSKHAQSLVGQSIEIKWGTSRGRDSYGYTTATLYHCGRRVAGCNGGGYDMRGTVVGNWVAATFPDELRAIKPEQMDAQSHWERAENPRRFCSDPCCRIRAKEKKYLAHDALACPHCGAETFADPNDGKRVDDGRYFYGLRFIDPNYDPLNAKLEHADGTFTKPEDVGKTFRKLQAEGKIVDLDIIRTAYKQTSPHATKRHIQPSIDGGCGMSSVMGILNAIGLTLSQVHDSKKLDVYTIQKHTPNR